MKVFLWLLRIVVGLLFIFSGLIKANDPLGLSYKMDEFFEVWHMTWMAPYSLALSVLMIGFEIIAGVAVLLGYAYRLFSFLLLLLITFFTFLTAYVLFSGKIKECGCFGDCIKISNEETFFKDLVLLVMIIILFIYRRRVQPLFGKYTSTSLLVLTTFFAFGMQWWTLEHLPFLDCLPYKVGANLEQDRHIPPGAIPDEYETVLVYKKDGVEKEFTTANYPWQDTTWVYVDTRNKLIRKGNAEPKIKDFVISDSTGTEVTEQILTAPGYTFLLWVKDPGKARTDNLANLRSLASKAQALHIPFYILCSASKEVAEKWRNDAGLNNVPVFVIDLTVTKTALRSNPGLMLLEKGVVRGKWSFRDYPKTLSYDKSQLILR